MLWFNMYLMCKISSKDVSGYTSNQMVMQGISHANDLETGLISNGYAHEIKFIVQHLVMESD